MREIMNFKIKQISNKAQQFLNTILKWFVFTKKTLNFQIVI